MSDPKTFTVYNLVTYVIEVQAEDEDQALDVARFADESDWEFLDEDFDVESEDKEDQFEIPF